MKEIFFEHCFTIGLTLGCLLLSLVSSFLLKKKYEQYKSNDLLSYIPTVWTSIGILGTFISIVYSLKSNKNDFEDITLLINNISPAFITSIIGILGSIVSSCYVKIIIASEESFEMENYQKFVENPKSIVDKGQLSQEMQLYSIYKNINEINASNDSKLQSILDYLQEILKPEGVLQQFHQNISQSIKSEISNVNDTLKDVVAQKLQDNISAVKKMQIKLSEDLGENGVVAQKLQNAVTAIGNMQNRLSNDLGEDSVVAQKLQNTVTAIGNMQNKISDDLGENGVVARKIHGAMSSITSELTTQNEKIKNFLDDLIKNISEYYRNVSKETADATIGLIEKNFVDYKTIFSNYNKELAENLQNYGDQIKAMEVKFVEDQNKALEESLNSNIENLQQRTQMIETINKELIEKLEDNKNNLNSSIVSFKDEVQTVMNEIYSEFVKNANENSQTLIGMSTELASNTEKSANQITEKLSALQTFVSAFQSLANENNNCVKSLTEHLSINESAIDKFNECLSNIDNNVKDYSELQSEFADNYEDSLSGLGSKINSKLDNSLREFGGKIEDVIILLKDSVNDTVNNNANTTREMMKQMSNDYTSSNKEERELLKELKKLM